MTMAWTTQAGLGPRTVALSLKVFIVVMFYTHGRLGICTAQPSLVLPSVLQTKFSELIEHFCTSGCADGASGSNCKHDQQSSKHLCLQMCSSGACNANCWNKAEPSLCNGNQSRVCGYSDADVCQDTNDKRTRTCVITIKSSPAFCICQSNVGSFSTIRCDPQERRHSQTQTTAGIATTQANTAQTTTAQATTAQVVTLQANAARILMTDKPINVVGIVFGTLFALLLLLVIFSVMILYLQAQGRLPSFKKQAINPDDLSAVVLEPRNSTRALLPELPVPDKSMDYSYTYDHIPAMLGAKADPNQDGPTYCSVGEDAHREGNPRYVLDRQRKKPTTQKHETTGNANDHPYFVLNRSDNGDEVGSESGGGRANGDEVTDSSTEVQAKEAIVAEYTPLMPTEDPSSRTEQYGNEVAVSPTSSKIPSPIDSPTKGLCNGDAGIYFPLILSAEPKSRLMEQSGHEDAKIPSSDSHDATSLTGVQSIRCDNDTYTLLNRTAEPKSQKERSENEIPVTPKPGLAANDDVPSSYDHLERKRESEHKECAPSTVDHDNYQQLINNNN